MHCTSVTSNACVTPPAWTSLQTVKGYWRKAKGHSQILLSRSQRLVSCIRPYKVKTCFWILMPETGNAESLGVCQFPGPEELQPEQGKNGKDWIANSCDRGRWDMEVDSEVLLLPEHCLCSKKEVCNVCSRPDPRAGKCFCCSLAEWRSSWEGESCSSSMIVHGLQVFTLNRARSSLLTTAGGLQHDQKKNVL